MNAPKSSLTLPAFGEAARRFADLVAFEYGNGTSIQYSEIWDHAGGIAKQILDQTGVDGRVAVPATKSADYIAALLGCWRAGATALIYDPSWPKQRIETVFRIAAPSQIFTTSELELLRGKPEVLTAGAVPDTDAESAAYTIFTSGSTGEPKGVDIPHAGFIPILEEQIAAFRLSEGTRSLWIHHPSFDASLSDIGTAFLVGATLCIEPEIEFSSPSSFLRKVEARQVSHIDIPPSLLSLLRPEECPECLKSMVIGGEVCPPDVVRSWAEKVRLISVYGPTEATICTSMVVCDRKWDSHCIGMPSAGIQYSIDSSVGDSQNAGELIIHGNAVSSGYLGNAKLSRRKFGLESGKRTFRSGDLVLETGDSTCGHVFLGRVDRQFKHHGKLISPEEVESILISHPLIQNAHLFAEKIGEHSRLTVVLEAGENHPETQELMDQLSLRLPTWMIPALFRFQKLLPRLPNGKLDRIRIESGCSSPVFAEPEVNPSLESKILNLFREVLGREDVSETDNFSEIGGDSLAFVSLLATAETVGIPLTSDLLRQKQNAIEIARLLDKTMGSSGMSLCDLKKHLAKHAQKWASLPTQTRVKPNRILVSGATGFLGSAVVSELLRTANVEVTCMVRGRPEEDYDRIVAGMKNHGADVSPDSLERLATIPADLEKLRFGWSEQEWEQRSATFDTIVHSGAETSLYADYEAAESPNVYGTRQMLDFLRTSRGRTELHYISTLSVFVDAAPKPLICLENDPADQPDFIFGGYAQSKWVAEQLVHDAAEAHWPVTIYRCGLLTANQKTGHSPASDLLTLYFRKLASGDACPPQEESTAALDFTPVDFAAAAIAHILTKSDPANHRVYHIANSTPLLFTDLVKAAREVVRAESVLSQCSPIHNLSLLDKCVSNPQLTICKATGTHFSVKNMETELHRSGIECPAPTCEFLGPFLRRQFKSLAKS